MPELLWRYLTAWLYSRTSSTTSENNRAAACPANRPADHETADHPCSLVWHAVVVVDPFYGECDGEAIAFVHEKARIPRECAFGNA